MRRTLLGLLIVSLLLAGCGDDDDTVATEETETATETDTDDGSTTTDRSTSSTTAASSGELPGERIDIFPYEDTVLAVVGVEAGDVLNVRAAPGPGQDVVAELDPLADGISPSGHNRQLDDGSIWAEITADGVTGWANTAFLAHLGDTDDVTSQLYPEVADRPRADTMLQLGEEVAAAIAGSEEPQPDVVVVDGPTVADLGEITVDVVGFPDDAVLGARVRVFAEPDPGGESFTVRSVESTTICRRAVSEGLCV
jgi:hypothetical protein